MGIPIMSLYWAVAARIMPNTCTLHKFITKCWLSTFMLTLHFLVSSFSGFRVFSRSGISSFFRRRDFRLRVLLECDQITTLVLMYHHCTKYYIYPRPAPQRTHFANKRNKRPYCLVFPTGNRFYIYEPPPYKPITDLSKEKFTVQPTNLKITN